MDGIINVYKEAGFTSFDVVAKLRGILHQKKIGHTGTLDPDAVGVLPVCIGKATKVCELLTNQDKTYRAVCRLGVETDTQDMSGTVLQRYDYSAVTEGQLRRIAENYLGDSEQIPPMYSALKVNGRKLYELAREGKEIERKPRKIHISQLELSDINLTEGTFVMEVTCSKGTYIRTLCHDIGKNLGIGAAMEHLTRTRVGIFLLEDALTLSEIGDLAENSPDVFLDRIWQVDSLFPKWCKGQVTEVTKSLLANGNRLPENGIQWTVGKPEKIVRNEQILVYDEQGQFKAIYEYTGRDYKVVKMF